MFAHPVLYEITIWVYFTGLDKLTEMTRIGVLTLGDPRHCKVYRADAVMSAIGVTRWKDDADAATMMLEKYPLSFVRDVFALNPAQFFGLSSKLRSNCLDYMLVHLKML